ncbi:MAG: hemerythrin family protein [Rhodospirillaceae bacterium]
MATLADSELKPVEWRNGLSVGVQTIDEEHQLLIGVLNRIIESLGSPSQYAVVDRVLRDLFAYADYHFEHEEDLMMSYSYPDIESHRAEHLIFISRLRQIDKGLSDGSAGVEDLARFVMSWFVNHILKVDMILGKFLADRLTRERSPFEFEVWRLPH